MKIELFGMKSVFKNVHANQRGTLSDNFIPLNTTYRGYI